MMRPDACAIVIPSCRTVSADMLSAIPAETPVYVVSDTERAIAPVRPNMTVFDLAFQRKVMGADYDLIPRGSSACRNFGFLFVWRYTGHDSVISLDDDVQPGEGFLEGFAHLAETRTFETVVGVPWFNTLDLLNGCEGLYPRGFPFTERHGAIAQWTSTTARVACHMGLWDGVLDTHAIDKHLFDDYREPRPDLIARRAIVRVGTTDRPTKFPLCSMNFGVTRDALPLVYQFPMPASFLDRYPLGRFEDIWAGYIAQTLLAIRGEAATVGAPIAHHTKVGALNHEMRSEHYGTLLSSTLFGIVDSAALRVRPAPYLEMYLQLAETALTTITGDRALHVPGVFREYLSNCFRSIIRWCALHASSGNGRVRPERMSGV